MLTARAESCPKGMRQEVQRLMRKHMPDSHPKNAPENGILPADLICCSKAALWMLANNIEKTPKKKDEMGLVKQKEQWYNKNRHREYNML